jgi:hypothetical protein
MRNNKYDLAQKWKNKREQQAKSFGLEYNKTGRYRKSHPLDCGKPHCMICHSDKILGNKTHRQELVDISMQEQLRDI